MSDKWEFVDFLNIKNQSPSIQLYTNQVINYYRKSGVFVGLPMRYCDRVKGKSSFDKMRFAKERKSIIDKYGRGGTAVSDTGIMLSHDGVNFELSKTAFVKPEYDSGNDWWYGGNISAYGLVETMADEPDFPNEISLYISKGYRVKKVDFWRYTVRLDGFFSWYGAETEVVTKPFVLENENMFINFATSASGGINIEILNKDGNIIDGYESGVLFGNSVNREVEFEKPLSDLVGKEVKIRFTLEDCHLYSYTFE